MLGTATIDGIYRYTLSRMVWEAGSGRLVWIMLNPSTATATVNDATIRRCIGFTRALGHREFDVVNLFAYRSKNPSDLKRVADPVGPENDLHIQRIVSGAARVIAAWGPNGAYQGRDRKVVQLLSGTTLYCLGLTKHGHPRHPLMMPKEPNLTSFVPTRDSL